ncbi:uncharacterized protein LOC113230928 [Hyposmocoma kahamanoa]|uniref:uncharacterized protein LOC113230928 n=1 Tax=Hyposmocoma kahamanoa TaxID=1477025 RepID=UPI000E6DA22B|nr:uncharacterized protein LOC113230928 [Hyposmocoma kahamanoa]
MELKDSLLPVSMENWADLQNLFKCDWPRGISAYTILETQRNWKNQGHDYGFKVFCPFGDGSNGMVAFNEKDTFYEIVVQCPSDNTKKLEEALKETKLVDWNRNIIIPFAPRHVIECIKNVVNDVNVEIDLILPSESFIYGKDKPIFDVSLPPDVTFGLLSVEHTELVDSTWPHRYPGSIWYNRLLISTKSGYGLFNNHELMSWAYINEAGTLGHVFTLEKYRRRGNAELLLKIICNKLLEEGKDIFAFCVKGNKVACNLYKKIGFDTYDCGVAWCYLRPK